MSELRHNPDRFDGSETRLQRRGGVVLEPVGPAQFQAACCNWSLLRARERASAALRKSEAMPDRSQMATPDRRVAGRRLDGPLVQQPQRHVCSPPGITLTSTETVHIPSARPNLVQPLAKPGLEGLARTRYTVRLVVNKTSTSARLRL